MDLRKTFLTATQSLAEAGIAHALIGAFGLAAWGVHRVTQDVDFLIDPKKKDGAIQALEKNGFKKVLESEDMVRFEGLGYLDIVLARLPQTQRMMETKILCEDFPIHVLTVEDIIALKIQNYFNDPSRAEQEKADIQNIIRKNRKLNWPKLKRYADLFQQWSVIEDIREIIR